MDLATEFERRQVLDPSWHRLTGCDSDGFQCGSADWSSVYEGPLERDDAGFRS
jgi:hypothetical protein